MYLHDQSQKTTYFGNNVLYLNFIDPLQNCFFHPSPTKIVHILEITCKEIVYIGYQSWEDASSGCEISMNTSITDEIIMYFGNWPKKKKCIFYQL